MLVYFSDTHGRGNLFNPSRTLDPSLVSKTIKTMREEKRQASHFLLTTRFDSLVILAEAPYADWSFYVMKEEANVLVLTLKDPQQSGYFTYVRNRKEEKKKLLSGIWDGTWSSLLLYACDKSLVELSRLSYMAGLLMENRFVPSGLWGDKQMAQKSFKDIFTVPRQNLGTK